MPEEGSGSAAKEAAAGLREILARIADFFDIFDLSFIISGAVTLAAIWFWINHEKIPTPDLPEGWIRVAGLIVGTYVLGLICFATGRWTRLRWRATRLEVGDRFSDYLQGHGLTTVSPFSDYLGRKAGVRLYVRLWAEVRQSPRTAASFALLRRYWVMAATYDGLVVALVVWAVAVILCVFGVGYSSSRVDPAFGVPAAILLLIAARMCAVEAGQYVDNQMEEIVASIAAVRDQE